jgi:Mn-containing catalase
MTSVQARTARGARARSLTQVLHNFFLEVGARTHKIRVYELTDHPIARQMLGYLFVRGGVHALAYAKALEELTGATVSKLLNIPNIPNSAFPETKKWEDQGLHRTLYRFSEQDFPNLGAVWKGEHPEDDQEVEVKQGPPEGGKEARLAAWGRLQRDRQTKH